MHQFLRVPVKRAVSSFRVMPKRLSSVTSTAAPATYSVGVQVMHWTMGTAVAGCVAFALLAQNIKEKEAKSRLMFLHKSCGLVAAGLLVPRSVFFLINCNVL